MRKRKNISGFSDFSVGDTINFSKAFEADDFKAFAKLSGDLNSLHHDAEYAANTPYGKPIVPLHMTIAPLSRIAGMNFPGESSLYLGHDLRAASPVYYGDRLTYSAKITALSPSTRTLTLQTIVLRGSEIVLEATMRVRALQETWHSSPELEVFPPFRLSRVVLTGATGAIGTAIAERLAAVGSQITALVRPSSEKRQKLESRFSAAARHDASLEFVTVDLANPSEILACCEQIARCEQIDTLIHAASAPIKAPLADLVYSNFDALNHIVKALLPGMLVRQNGAVVFLSSVAALNRVPGWEAYAAAKVMGSNYVHQFDKSYGPYGIRGLNVYAGLVDTEFSRELEGTNLAMNAAEVADHILFALQNQDRAETSILIEAGKSPRSGSVQFSDSNSEPTPIPFARVSSSSATSRSDSVSENDDGVTTRLQKILARTLGIPDLTSPETAGIGETPGWDSLRQIEIVLATEKEFSVQFHSEEIGELQTYRALLRRVQQKVT